MKGLKRLVSFGLGICMFVTGVPKASAQIEMWTFSDGTRVSRFKYTDIDDMIAFYESLVQENNKRLFTKKQNKTIKTVGIGAGICLLIGSAVSVYSSSFDDNDDNSSKIICACIFVLAGLASVAGSFYPEYIAHKVKEANVSGGIFERNTAYTCWMGLEDICTLLRFQKERLDELKQKGVEDPIPYEEMDNGQKIQLAMMGGKYKLLEWKDVQQCPYLLLVERPKSAYKEECRQPSSFDKQYISGDLENDKNLERRLKEIFNRLKREGLTEEPTYTIINRVNSKGEIDYEY